MSPLLLTNRLVEVLDETIDLGIPTDAGYGTGLAPQEEDDNDEDIQRAIAASRGGFVSSARHDAYPPGYGQAEPSYAQGGTALSMVHLRLEANTTNSGLRAGSR